jgi:membrane-bound lytic murein transglycosylase B
MKLESKKQEEKPISKRNTVAPLILSGLIAIGTYFHFSPLVEQPQKKVQQEMLTKTENIQKIENIKKEEEREVIRPKKATLKKVEKFLISSGFSKQDIDSIFSDSRLEKLGIFSKKTGTKKVLTYEQYKKIFGVELLTAKALQFYSQYKNLLDSLSEKTNVPQEMVMSIIGIETIFGKNTGNHGVLNVYLTMIEDVPRRERFALDQIKALFLLAKKYNVNIYEIKGSHGGAIGPMQFIPSMLVKFEDKVKIKNFEELYQMENAIKLVYAYLEHSGATKNEKYLIKGRNYNAAFAYNPSDFYARLVIELSDNIKKRVRNYAEKTNNKNYRTF